MFSVIEKATGRWIGRVGANHPEGWPGTEVGWAIDRAAWGKGYALEAAAASMNFVVDHLGWTEVIHCIDPENLASRRLAERLGSRILRQATLPPPVTSGEVDIWGQSRAEWRERVLPERPPPLALLGESLPPEGADKRGSNLPPPGEATWAGARAEGVLDEMRAVRGPAVAILS